MAIVYANAGVVQVSLESRPGGWGYTWRWIADSNGVAVLNGINVEGWLRRLESYGNTALAYAVYLYHYGADILQGLCTNLTADTATSTAIYADLGTDRVQRFATMGDHTLRIVAAANEEGVTELLMGRKPMP